MSKIQVYGKSTCKTTQKVQEWITANNLEFEQIDILSLPPSSEFLQKNIDEDDLKSFLNSRNKIYREKGYGKKLPSKAVAIENMHADPNLIKRPVVVSEKGVSFGFDENYLNKLK